MLPWWGWLLFWVVLVGASGVWLALLSRRVWAKGKVLTAEVTRVSGLVDQLEARVDELREADTGPTAVTRDPHGLREEYREQRVAQKADRAARRADRLPPWARVH